ncbi:MAG: ScyD/ScyE family protein [Thermomicrobiales bacterium]
MPEIRRVDRRTLLAIAAGGSASLALGGIAFARQDASPAASPEASPAAPAGGGLPPLPQGATPVAQGLWNPGDLALGPDGTIYIAESGVAGGGTEPGTQATPLPNGTPVTAAPPLVPPQISAVAPDGTQIVLTTEIGGVGIGVRENEVYVSTGGGSVGSGFAPLPQENTISAFDLTSQTSRVIASLGPYEVEHNPDGLDVNPNLYGLAITKDGVLYVADAGGNTIYTVDPATGEFSLFAVVPNLTDLTGATPTAEDPARQPGPRQPVPTSVVVNDDGTVTVALLGESWDGPSLLTFTADGSSYTAHDVRIPMIVSATRGPDGFLYVCQLTADLANPQTPPGGVFRLDADLATAEQVAEGFFPHGIAFSSVGNLFVTLNSSISGPDAPLGMVVRFDHIATPA